MCQMSQIAVLAGKAAVKKSASVFARITCYPCKIYSCSQIFGKRTEASEGRPIGFHSCAFHSLVIIRLRQCCAVSIRGFLPQLSRFSAGVQPALKNR